MKLVRRSTPFVAALVFAAAPALAQTGSPPTSLSQSLQGDAKAAYDSGELLVANGDYVVQMELTLSKASSPVSHISEERRVTLQGGTTSIDLSQAILRRSDVE